MRLPEHPPRFPVITVARIPAYGVSGARTNATPETRAEQSWKEMAGLIDKYGPTTETDNEKNADVNDSTLYRVHSFQTFFNELPLTVIPSRSSQRCPSCKTLIFE